MTQCEMIELCIEKAMLIIRLSLNYTPTFLKLAFQKQYTECQNHTNMFAVLSRCIICVIVIAEIYMYDIMLNIREGLCWVVAIITTFFIGIMSVVDYVFRGIVGNKRRECKSHVPLLTFATIMK